MVDGRALILVAALLLGVVPYAAAQERPAHPWPHAARETLADRIAPPEGFHRVAAAEGSFAAWLRGLPVKPAGEPVRLHDGRLKGNQSAQAAVLDIDVGRRDLQQCADAVMRLRAEYLRAAGQDGQMCFRLTSGDAVSWSRWAAGERPRVRGKSVTWSKGGERDGSYASFRRYLDLVFMYAGTFSLARDLAPASTVEIGDVFVQGGFPGHAVLVVDAAENAAGRRLVLLAQSYMPAQDIHVLRNPAGRDAWYPVPPGDILITPEWIFRRSPPRRFPDGDGCRPPKSPRPR